MGRVFAKLILAALLVLATWGCGEPDDFRGVYEEVDTASSGRSHALRLTLFEFADEVGGFIEFYPIGEGANPPENPFFVREHCAAFGAGPRRSDQFLVQLSGLDGRSFSARFEQGLAGDELIARVSQAGGLERIVDAEEIDEGTGEENAEDGEALRVPVETPVSIQFVRAPGDRAERSCGSAMAGGGP